MPHARTQSLPEGDYPEHHTATVSLPFLQCILQLSLAQGFH